VAKAAPQPAAAALAMAPPPVRIVRPAERADRVERVERAERGERRSVGPTDYAALERPTIERQQRAVGDGLRAPVESEDLLDIPAFLRRQAD
jgi:hypothetical protein